MRHQLISLSLALGLAAGLTQAQTPNAQQDLAAPLVRVTQDSTNFHSDSALRGMDLWSTKDGEGDRVDIGDINDFVINARSGVISHVVISSGGLGSVGDTIRALPWSQVEWSKNEDGDMIASVPMMEEQFKALPGFDVKDIDKLVGPKAVEANAQRLRDGKKDMDRQEARDATKGAREASAMAASNHLCSKIAGLNVYGPSDQEPFTSVGSLVFDCDNARVAFVTVEANDETYLVPFSVLSIRPVATDEAPKDRADVEYAVWSPMNEKAMEGAPSIDEDAKRTAQNARFRAQVYSHYGVEAPSPAGKAKDAAKADGNG